MGGQVHFELHLVHDLVAPTEGGGFEEVENKAFRNTRTARTRTAGMDTVAASCPGPALRGEEGQSEKAPAKAAEDSRVQMVAAPGALPVAVDHGRQKQQPLLHMDSQMRENHTSKCGDAQRDGARAELRKSAPPVGAEIDVVDLLVQALL